MIKISIILVNYNTSDHILKCLSSLKSILDFYDHEIIIVDNDSIENELEKLKNISDNIKIIHNNVNVGFGAACNIGAKNSLGKYLLFINPDTIFIEDAFPELIKTLENNSEIAVASCALVNQHMDYVYSFNDFPRLKYEFTEAIGSGTHNDIQKKIEFLKNNQSKIFECDWVIGAFMFIRKTKFDKVGGFDESFFLYYEDTDLCKRIKDAGNQIVVIPYIKVIHTQMSSVRSPQGENIFYYHLNRSNLIYSHKHFSFLMVLTIRLLHAIGYGFRIVSLPLRSRFKNKRKFKLSQYLTILSLYLSSYDKILKARNKTFNEIHNGSHDNDEFWKK